MGRLQHKKRVIKGLTWDDQISLLQIMDVETFFFWPLHSSVCCLSNHLPLTLKTVRKENECFCALFALLCFLRHTASVGCCCSRLPVLVPKWTLSLNCWKIRLNDINSHYEWQSFFWGRTTLSHSRARFSGLRMNNSLMRVSHATHEYGELIGISTQRDLDFLNS